MMEQLDSRLNGTLLDGALFRAVVPIRVHGMGFNGVRSIPFGLATNYRGVTHEFPLKMGGSCDSWFTQHGVQILLFP
jgi:hypothetical protein